MFKILGVILLISALETTTASALENERVSIMQWHLAISLTGDQKSIANGAMIYNKVTGNVNVCNAVADLAPPERWKMRFLACYKQQTGKTPWENQDVQVELGYTMGPLTAPFRDFAAMYWILDKRNDRIMACVHDWGGDGAMDCKEMAIADLD